MSWKGKKSVITGYDLLQREEFSEKGSSSSVDGLDNEVTWASSRQTVSKWFAYGIIGFLCAVIVLLSVWVAVLIPKDPKSPVPHCLFPNTRFTVACKLTRILEFLVILKSSPACWTGNMDLNLMTCGHHLSRTLD